MRQPRAAFGKLRGELAIAGFAFGFLFENFFDFGGRERREMKLQAARYDRRQQHVRRRSGQDQRGRAGRLFQNFQEDVGDFSAHRLGAIDNENAAPAHRLKVRGALNGAQLTDA